jgi:hypothetical protein
MFYLTFHMICAEGGGWGYDDSNIIRRLWYGVSFRNKLGKLCIVFDVA